jgi:hypothetical protein
MASTELSLDVDFRVMVDSPYKQGAPNDRNFLQAPAVGPDVFGGARCYGRPGRDRIKAPVCRFVVARAQKSGVAAAGYSAFFIRICDL